MGIPQRPACPIFATLRGCCETKAFSYTNARRTIGRILARFAVTALATAIAFSAAAHPLSVSYSEFSVNGTSVSAIFRLPMDDMDLLFSLDADLNDRVTMKELDASASAVNAYIHKNVSVRAEQNELAPLFQRSAIWHDDDGATYLQANVTYTAPAPITRLTIKVRLLTDLYPGHRNLAEVNLGNVQRQFVFQHQNKWIVERTVLKPWATVKEFLFLGIEHILTGYDHLLFLLGLLLVGRGLRDLLAIVSSFTVAHSLTMAAAVIGIAQPPGWAIEPAIALTIMYIGVENLVTKDIRHRWKLAFAFGLIHGFGFASVLQALALKANGLLLTLVPFNLGVEIGQITVIVCLLPLLNKVRKSRFQLPAMRCASTLIAAAGLFWFVERVT